jgi:hypothetical protein
MSRCLLWAIVAAFRARMNHSQVYAPNPSFAVLSAGGHS